MIHFGVPELIIILVIVLVLFGVGRIGTRVLRRTKAFGTPKILVNDTMPNYELNREFKLDWVTKEQIYQEADLISLHLRLTHLTKNMIRREQLLFSGVEYDMVVEPGAFELWIAPNAEAGEAVSFRLAAG